MASFDWDWLDHYKKKYGDEQGKLVGLYDKKKETALPPALENLCSEVWNGYTNPNGVPVPGRERIIFRNIHPESHKHFFFGQPPEFWSLLICDPGEWVFLPHGLYAWSTASGQPPRVTINFGDRMFKGNKLPSRPEASKVRVFQK